MENSSAFMRLALERDQALEELDQHHDQAAPLYEIDTLRRPDLVSDVDPYTFIVLGRKITVSAFPNCQGT